MSPRWDPHGTRSDYKTPYDHQKLLRARVEPLSAYVGTRVPYISPKRTESEFLLILTNLKMINWAYELPGFIYRSYGFQLVLLDPHCSVETPCQIGTIEQSCPGPVRCYVDRGWMRHKLRNYNCLKPVLGDINSLLNPRRLLVMLGRGEWLNICC